MKTMLTSIKVINASFTPFVIAAYLNQQQEAAIAEGMPKSFKAINATRLQTYAELCYNRYTKHLNRCRNVSEHKKLYKAIRMRLNRGSREFLNAK